ncbi:helix-turn-helix domain-containing protein, partial [Bacteroidales bacterium OttesenSCG-928-L14]|nr:helix-turn-helix domain-containing protein [Bacteroidales bacterium OttesenSCG-928-L14]
LRAYSKLSFIYMSEVNDEKTMDTLLILFDEMDAEARKQNNLTQQGLIRGNILVSFKNKGMFDEVIRRAPEYFDFMIENELWRIYYQSSVLLIDSYRSIGQYEKAINEAQHVYDLAKEQNDDGGMGTALYCIANTYNQQERWEDAEKYFRECIKVLHPSDTYLNILTQAYAFLCATLRNQQLYDEAIQLAPEFEEAVRRFEKVSNSSQPTAWTNFYNSYMYTYLEKGDYDKAEFYCNQIENTVNVWISQYEILRARTLIAESRHQYPEALIKIDSALVVVGNDDNLVINEMKKIKLRILIQLGKTDSANKLLDEILEAQKSITDLEVNAKFDEIRTQYEVDKHIAEKEKTRNYLIFAITICVLLISGLLIVLIFYRQKQLAYRKLVRKSQQWAGITEIDHQEEIDNNEVLVEQIDSIEEVDIKDENLPDSTDISIMDLIEVLMKEKKIFTNPDISIDTLSKELGINRRYISSAINRTTKKHFFTYINEYRIKEAICIMSDPANDKYTLDSIALDIGFNDRQAFHRVFKLNTGVTPAVFRRESVKG